jgi:uncharacterized membrane protein (UPF0182 family)
MRDMFDEFMEELRRRQAELEGKTGQERAKAGPGEPAGTDEEPEAGGGAGETETGAPDTASPDAASEDEETVTSMNPEPDDGFTGDTDEQPTFGRGGPGGGRGSGGGRWQGGPFDEYPEFHISRGWVIVGVIVVALFVLSALFSLSVGLITDGIWFNSIGFSSVFWTRLGAQVSAFAGGFLVAFLFIWFNLWLAGRLIPKSQLRRFSLDELLDRFNVERYMGGGLGSGPYRRPRPVGGRAREEVAIPNVGRPLFWILLAIGTFAALGFGGLLSTDWTTIQLFIHRVPFGQTDPTNGLDISFYLFELPFYRLFQTYTNSLLLLAVILAGIRYLVAVVSGASMPTPARVHLGLLVMAYLWSIAIGYQLDRYELVYSGTSGIFQGVSYTDANARVLAINAMTGIVLFIGAMVAYLAYARSATPLALVLVAWVGVYFALDVGYPLAVQRLVVEPNQQAQETPYIKSNIDMTRLAFNLDGWNGSSYTPAATITEQAVVNEPGTIQNIRLWDKDPLESTLDQVQIIRSYYTFTTVNTDRYTFTDAASCSPAPPPCVRQVMLSGREIDPSKLSDQSWVNEHITYTHGMGLAMVPVNEVGAGGQPNLLIENLPPTSVPGTPTISQPRIYFGLQGGNYVIVDAASQEFDYPTASGDQYYSWTGTSGIKLDTPLIRLLYAAKFGQLNLLISNQITGSSQLLYNRSITDRVQAIAPYLRYDQEPYLVVSPDGQLYYMLDAYTTSAAFPDSQPYDPSLNQSPTGITGDAFNYIRNSVKVVMNAYDGSMSFYVADPNDPIIRAWEGVFPGVYKPVGDMPEGLQSHIRYPQGIFDAQTVQFAKYHVTDPGVFYQGVQFWQVPVSPTTSSGGPTQLALQSFYVEMRVPGDSADTFMLLQPMVLQNRPNMIAWVAAYNDYPTTYGQVKVFDFPESTNVFGPVQMESLIQQNQQISQQITLWEGAGSHVVLGNLLVIPLEDTLMYVEPVYLQAANSPLPVFQKVVVGTPTQIVWGNSLTDALTQIYAGQGTTGGGTSPGGSPGPSPTPGASAGPTATPAITATPGPLPSLNLSGTAQQLIAEANAHYEAAQAALRAGDLGKYQEEMNTVGQILAKLQSTLGTPAPTLVPSATPSGQ